MCATRSDGRRELAAEDKRRILLKIISQLSDVEEIDFAGGDPMADRDSRKIISEAIDQLGHERISVTTTGLGIRQLSEAERERWIYRCAESACPVFWKSPVQKEEIALNQLNYSLFYET